jgi:tetratricopeptide (TPR) repeat protein
MTSGLIEIGSGTSRSPGRFVGRDAELAILARAGSRAAAGHRQVVVVSGEAGIGKTHLCERAAERAERDGWRVVWGRCWPYGGAPPLWPWPAVLADLAGAAGARLLAADPGNATVDPERFARFAAVADLLTRHVDGEPTMVVVDDLHAAAEGTLLLTRFLARALDRVPLLLVLARRPCGPADGVDGPAADLERDATVVPLRRFGLADTAAFLEAHGLERAGAGGELATTVLRVTGGNPLFLTRVVAHGSPSPGLAGVEQAVGDAVARLAAPSRRIVALLAVLGRSASIRDVADLAGQTAPEVLDALEEARRAGLVEPAAPDRYTFGHDLIHAAAGAVLTAAERLDAHARAAALTGASNRPDRFARWAHHALAAAPRSDADADIAVDACRTAARAMRHGFDFQRAAALLDAAVAVGGTRPASPWRAALLVERAEAVLACGRLTAARTAFTEAAAVIDGRVEPALQARAALGLGGVWLNEHRDPLDRRRVLAMQRAAGDALGDQETSLRARLAMRLAAESVYDGGPLAAVHGALADVRRAGGQQALAEALSLAHHAMLGPEHAHTRLALAEELLTVASAAGEGVLALLGLLWRTVDLYHLGDPRAERALAELRERADAIGCQSILYIVAAIDVMRLVRAGRLDEAETAAGTCFELGVDVGDADAAGYYGAQLSAIRWVQGRDGELLDLVTGVVASPTLPTLEFAFAAAAAAMAARVGRADDARAALDLLVTRGLAKLPSGSTWLVGMVAIGETAGLLGDAAIAGEVHRLLTPFADLPVVPSLAVACFGSTERTLGITALACGDITGAVAHHERAVEANRRIGNRPATAIARADLAAALVTRAGDGDLERARALWDQARREAAAMDLPVRVEEWAARSEAAHAAQSAGRAAGFTGPSAGRAAARSDGAVRDGVLAHDADGWTITADGRRTVMPDLVGLRYLADLLERPGVAVSVLDLCGSSAFDAGHHEIADRQALAAYRRRLRELDADLDEADADSDLERAHRLRLDRDAIRDHLALAIGLAGRARTFPATTERARTAVRKAVKRALDTIAAADPALGAELQAGITTGTTCRHTPDPARPRHWTIRR